MKFSESLKKNRDFQSVYRKGKPYGNKYLVMYLLANDLGRKSWEQHHKTSFNKADP